MSEKNCFGVDVCKKSLAFCGPGQSGQVPNNALGQRCHFDQQLRQRNKPPKVALTAVIRKLAILLNQLLQNPDFVLSS